MYSSKFATILSLITVLIVGISVFIYNKTIDYLTIVHALKIIIPAGTVAYFGGYFLEKILKSSTNDATVINKTAQRKFVDDLLLTPEQVLTLSKLHTYTVDEPSNSTGQNKGIN